MQQWKLLEQVFTVETIMTPRSELLMWSEGQDIHTLWNKADEKKIDTIPILRRDEITNVFLRNTSEAIPIPEDRYIPYNAPIPVAVESLASKNSFPRLFVTFQSVVVGLVAPADLNKLSARTYFYNLLAEMEMQIAASIRDTFGDDVEKILDVLKSSCAPDRYEQVCNTIRESELASMENDVVTFLNFSELVRMVSVSIELQTSLGFPSRTQVDKHLNGLVNLRNDVMHSVKLILGKDRNISKLCKEIERAQDLLNKWGDSH